MSRQGRRDREWGGALAARRACLEQGGAQGPAPAGALPTGGQRRPCEGWAGCRAGFQSGARPWACAAARERARWGRGSEGRLGLRTGEAAVPSWGDGAAGGPTMKRTPWREHPETEFSRGTRRTLVWGGGRRAEGPANLKLPQTAAWSPGRGTRRHRGQALEAAPCVTAVPTCLPPTAHCSHQGPPPDPIPDRGGGPRRALHSGGGRGGGSGPLSHSPPGRLTPTRACARQLARVKGSLRGPAAHSSGG